MIEPGLIRTSFGETAVGSVPEHEGPYTEFNTAVAKATAGAYDGPQPTSLPSRNSVTSPPLPSPPPS